MIRQIFKELLLLAILALIVYLFKIIYDYKSANEFTDESQITYRYSKLFKKCYKYNMTQYIIEQFNPVTYIAIYLVTISWAIRTVTEVSQ